MHAGAAADNRDGGAGSATSFPACRLPGGLHEYPELDSTNSQAGRLLASGLSPGFAVIASRQTGGRGRLERTWHSAPDLGLYLSLALQPRVDASSLPQATLVAAVAVSDAIVRISGADPRIKWPNDILIADRKVSGILAELFPLDDGASALILGVGLNLNHGNRDFPEDLGGRATSLRLATGRRFEPGRALGELLASLLDRFVLWETAGFAGIREAWIRRSHTLGRAIRLESGGRTIQAVAEDLGQGGELLARDSAGRLHELIAGDIDG